MSNLLSAVLLWFQFFSRLLLRKENAAIIDDLAPAIATLFIKVSKTYTFFSTE